MLFKQWQYDKEIEKSKILLDKCKFLITVITGEFAVYNLFFSKIRQYNHHVYLGTLIVWGAYLFSVSLLLLMVFVFFSERKLNCESLEEENINEAIRDARIFSFGFDSVSAVGIRFRFCGFLCTQPLTQNVAVDSDVGTSLLLKTLKASAPCRCSAAQPGNQYATSVFIRDVICRVMLLFFPNKVAVAL